MPWHFCVWGEWSIPKTLEEIENLTSGMPNLFLMAGGLGDEEVSVLRSHPRVIGLAIVCPQITLATTATLRTLPRLRELILCGPTITDAFLLALAGMTTLQEVTLVHTACSVRGVRRFLKSVPGCKVYKGGADSIYPASTLRELHLFVPDNWFSTFLGWMDLTVC